jgi:sulfite dehydrogenase (quinone) subunit SoeB
VSRLVADRGGIDLMPEQGTRPVNKYLPPREEIDLLAPLLDPLPAAAGGVLGWLDRTLARL